MSNLKHPTIPNDVDERQNLSEIVNEKEGKPREIKADDLPQLENEMIKVAILSDN